MLCFVLLLCQKIPAAQSPAESAVENDGMNVILVMDYSGSMKYTDPDRLADEAALLFLDMMEEKGCRAGIIAFSDTVEILRPVQALEMSAQRDGIRELLRAKARGGDTDLGAAAKAALEMADENTAVVFFTDGQIDLSDEEQVLRSKADAQEAVLEAKERAIPFFCVGLDDRENVSSYHLDRQFLRAITDGTGGAFRSVTRAGELPDLFHRIFSDYIETKSVRIGDLRSGGGKDASLSFSIPNSSVLEANIILLPASSPEDAFSPETSLAGAEGEGVARAGTEPVFSLEDPEGNAVSLHSEKARISVSRAYTLVKLILPSRGIWSIRVSSEEDYAVHVNLLFHYEAELGADVLEDAAGNAQVKAYLTGKGERLDDPDLYRQLVCSVEAERENTPSSWKQSKSTQYVLDYDETEGCWSGSVAVYPGSTVTLHVKADGEELSREAGPLRFTSERSDDIIVDRLPDAVFLEGMFPGDTGISFPAGQFFRSWDGSGISLALEEEEGGLLKISEMASAADDPEDAEYLLSGVKSGRTVLILRAEDQYGNVRTERIPVQVLLYWETLRWVTGLGSALALAVLPGVLVRRRKRRACVLSGTVWLMDHICAEEEGEAFCLDGAPSGESFGMIASHTLQGVETAHAEAAFLQRFSRAEQAQILLALQMIRVYKCRSQRRGFQVRLQNRGRTAFLCDCYGNRTKRVLLQNADVFEIRFPEGMILFGAYYVRTDEPSEGYSDMDAQDKGTMTNEDV